MSASPSGRVLPFLNLPVSRWEYQELQAKDENFNLVFDSTDKPVLGDTWVNVYLRAPNGEEVLLTVDRGPFDLYILPQLKEHAVR